MGSFNWKMDYLFSELVGFGGARGGKLCFSRQVMVICTFYSVSEKAMQGIWLLVKE